MKKTTPIKYTFMGLAFCLFLSDAMAAKYLPEYEATYLISRNDKPTAKQKTTFYQQANNSFVLKDFTEGTHGLAALSGFERTEATTFKLENMHLEAISHEMKQDAAFSHKLFKFSLDKDSDLILGQSKKKSFELNTEIKPISAHMLPWWLSVLVCEGQQNILIPVMKSKKIKTYQFKVIDTSEDLIQVDRVYEPDTEKTSQIWFNKKLQCFPVRTRHQEKNEPVIETTLIHHNLPKHGSLINLPD